MKKNETHSGYGLTRNWFDFAWENEGKVSSNHTALFMWLIEINNRLGWAKEFEVTSKECMKGMCCRSHNTYIKTFKDLIEWGFVTLIKKSENQFQSNVIALSKNNISIDKSLDRTVANHLTNHLTHSINNKQQTTNHKQDVGVVLPSEYGI